MERMWRKVSGRQSKRSTANRNDGTATINSSNGFESVSSNVPVPAAISVSSNNATGRRLASSGKTVSLLPTLGNDTYQPTRATTLDTGEKTFSQIVLQNKNASSEYRRHRRHRKTRPRRMAGVSCVSGGGGDNMSSSGGFYTINESPNHSFTAHNLHKYQNQIISPNAPSGTILMYPNSNTKLPITTGSSAQQQVTLKIATTGGTSDVSLRQRAVAKLRMFNFNINWDLHMTQCKPCGPRIPGSGNIITRRLCRNRRSEDNELYRSNSFKFERFERKECLDELSDALQKQIAICDDYSLPVDFVKKRPSSFDPCLADTFQSTPEIWAIPSPQTNVPPCAETAETIKCAEVIEPQVFSAIVVSQSAAGPFSSLNSAKVKNTLHSLKQKETKAKRQSQAQLETNAEEEELLKTADQPVVCVTQLLEPAVELLDGYLSPKDSKQHKSLHSKRDKQRRKHKNRIKHKSGKIRDDRAAHDKKSKVRLRGARRNDSSDSSAPKSSDDDEDDDIAFAKVKELNSPDSITEDILRPLNALAVKSPIKQQQSSTTTLDNKITPSPYYYSDLLKSNEDKSTEISSTKSQTTILEPPTYSEPKKKSPAVDKSDQNKLATTAVLQLPNQAKRYSFTEDGVHIIRCESQSTSTSEESDCSECQKRRKWHARALALVRKTCNVVPINDTAAGDARKPKDATDCAKSMSPRHLLAPTICNCINEDLGEFQPRNSQLFLQKNSDNDCSEFSSDLKLLRANLADELDRDMSGRTRQLYETAFDCKVAKSDDDLDEVDRITNHSILFDSNNRGGADDGLDGKPTKTSAVKSRLEVKRLKNSKNQAIQEQTSNSGGNNSESGSTNTLENNSIYIEAEHERICGLATNMAGLCLNNDNADKQANVPTTSAAQLLMCGYTPSPPSTAPLPMKFPCKQDMLLINSIKSAPNLPYTNPAHPRLRDLRLPIHPQSLLRNKQYESSSLADSNEISQSSGVYANQAPIAPQPAKSNSKSGSKARCHSRPRSFVLEPGRVVELRKSHGAHQQHAGSKGGRSRHNFSSTESIATSSSDGSMESLRSSTSEGNRSTSSSDSRHSTSLSSHSSESGSCGIGFPVKASVMVHTKLHILSPISDKSSQEPSSEQTEHNKPDAAAAENGNVQRPQGTAKESSSELQPNVQLLTDPLKKRRLPANKLLVQLADEIPGSDSGISLLSREDGKPQANLQSLVPPKLKIQMLDKTNDSGISDIGKVSTSTGLPQDLRDLPFDMPKLRRRKALQQEGCTSGSATSVDLGDLPFDMPKLRRRLRANGFEATNTVGHSTESSGISQASSIHSMRDDKKLSQNDEGAMFRKNLTLNLNEPRQANKFGSLDLRGISSGKDNPIRQGRLFTSAVDLIDVSIPLERQGWYHGAITRIEAETTLRPLTEGSFLVRNCESTKQDYSLSLKGAKGFMHMRIQRNDSGQYILGQFSRPFDNVSEMIRHFCINRLPVRGAEHMCLIDPVIAPLL